MMRARGFMVVASTTAWLAGCLDLASAPAQMCKATADCDSANGEVCSDGTCYGNPPTGAFAALVSPPSTRADLVARQMLDFRIPLDGRFPDVQLDEPVTLKGTLVGCQQPLPCDSTSLDATITVTGKPSFTGGPSYLAVFDAQARQGFDLVVPRTHGAGTYSVTITPAGREKSPGAGTTAAQLVPPLHQDLTFAESKSNLMFDLGKADDTAPFRAVHGKIVTIGGVPVSNYRVVAVGRWDADAAPVEVSTVDYTGTDGTYSLRLSSGLVGKVQIVATSYDAALRPTLTLAGVSTTEDSSAQNLSLPDRLGTQTPVSVSVDGVDGSGKVGPVSGATVTVVGSVMAGTTRATITAQATTDENGVASDLALLDGGALAASYRMAIVPPANATVGVLLDEPLAFGASREPLRLPARIALRGVVRDHDGMPAKDVSVTARPSLRFLWNLEPALQSVLSAIPPATTVTPESGEYVVFVDRALGEVWGRYDLAFEATSAGELPSFTQGDVELPRDGTLPSVAVADTQLPDAAYVHGEVVDPHGKTVEGAELKIYKLPAAELALCAEVPYAPASCPVPAQLLGRAASGKAGELRVILPR